jgi:hypothetical protein
MEGLNNNLCNVKNFHITIGILLGVIEHDHAEWASYCQGFGTSGLGFLETVGIDPLCAFLFFFPHLGSACTAAEGFLTVAGKFNKIGLSLD